MKTSEYVLPTAATASALSTFSFVARREEFNTVAQESLAK
jgi:hypothetical protein